MKRILAIILVAFSIFGLASCVSNKDVDNKVPNPPVAQPETPEKPEVPETPEEEAFKLYGENFEQAVFQTVDIDTTNLTEIKITVVGENFYLDELQNLPINLINFKVDGNIVDIDGISGNTYRLDYDFKIGELNAKGRLINLHTGNKVPEEHLNNLRLHNWHSKHGTDHYITVDVSDVDSFAFDFAATTGAVASLENIRVDFTYKA